MSTNSSTGSFFKGFVFGGVIGAVAALLMAPQSGEKTRTQIREKGIELKEKAEATYVDVQKRVEAATVDLRSKIDELSAKVDEVIAQVKRDLSQEDVEVTEQVAPEELTTERPVVEKAVSAS